MLLLIRLSGYDPTVFARWSERLLAAAPDVGAAMRHDIATCLEQVLIRTYAVSPKDDVRFAAARVYYRLGRIPEAAAQFARVASDMPNRRAAWYNLGLCSEREGRHAEARGHYQRALELDPAYAKAESALARISA